MRGLTPARALAPALTPAAPSAVQHPAAPVAVPLRRPKPTNGRPSSPGTGPAVQRAVAPGAPTGRAVPLLSASKSVPGTTPPTSAPRAIPQAAPWPSTSPAPAVVQRQAAAVPRAPKAPGNADTNTNPFATTRAPAPARAAVPVQRVPVQRESGGPPLPTPATTTTAVSAVSVHGTSSRGPSASGSTSDPHKTHKTPDPDEPPPEYTAVPEGKFDPRSLTDFQLDELTHKLVGRITRLIRTELRLDRERIGKLRDPRR